MFEKPKRIGFSPTLNRCLNNVFREFAFGLGEYRDGAVNADDDGAFISTKSRNIGPGV